MFVGDEQTEYRPVEKVRGDYRSYLLPVAAMITDAGGDLLVVNVGDGGYLPHLLKLFPRIHVEAYYSSLRLRDPRITIHEGELDDFAPYSRDILLVINHVSLPCRPWNIYRYFKDFTERVSRWYKTIRPFRCLIRFSLPYPGVMRYLDFLDGTLLAIPFSYHPTFCYLIPNGMSKKWDLTEFDRRMAFFQVKKKRKYLSRGKLVSYDEAYEDFVLDMVPPK